MAFPEASIIIPNFNNGRESSVDGDRNLLDELLHSLQSTLGEDLARVEIVIADDGSTDDSLATARNWAAREGAGGRSFLRLIELEHEGVLSSVLNRLMSETSAPIVFRFDGDIVLRSKGWLDRGLEAFASMPGLGVLGGCQLDHLGRVHSLGDLLFHPHGYQHIGSGLESPVDCPGFQPDHVMGCFHVLRRAAFDEVGAYDPELLRGQTIDLGLALRTRGWTSWTDPKIIFSHHFALRSRRATGADSHDGINRSRAAFRTKWGFDRTCPDLDVMRSRLGASVVPVYGPDVHDSAGIDESQEVLLNRVELVRGALRPGVPTSVLSIGAGDGSLEAELAEYGISVTAIEDRPFALDEFIGGAGLPPHLLEDLGAIPIESGSIDLLLLDRALERSGNPIRILEECHRMLSADGVLLLLVRSMTARDQLDDPRRFDRFTPSGLRSFLSASGLFDSIAVSRRPMPCAEPGVLFYALRRARHGSSVIAEPIECL
ncbi:MAG TPA: hypothetical protein DCX60_06410 [Phycisphaerales bacterium]|nr:hypothetical protein [Phycisphaerales bacterium]